MGALKILQDLVSCIDAANDVMPENVRDVETASEELKAYWKAFNIAKEYIKKAIQSHDDLGTA